MSAFGGKADIDPDLRRNGIHRSHVLGFVLVLTAADGGKVRQPNLAVRVKHLAGSKMLRHTTVKELLQLSRAALAWVPNDGHAR